MSAKRKGFWRLIYAAAYDRRLSLAELRYLIFLVDKADDQGRSWYGSIATGKTIDVSPRHVRRLRRRLVELGYVKIRPRGPGRSPEVWCASAPPTPDTQVRGHGMTPDTRVSPDTQVRDPGHPGPGPRTPRSARSLNRNSEQTPLNRQAGRQVGQRTSDPTADAATPTCRRPDDDDDEDGRAEGDDPTVIHLTPPPQPDGQPSDEEQRRIDRYLAAWPPERVDEAHREHGAEACTRAFLYLIRRDGDELKVDDWLEWVVIHKGKLIIEKYRKTSRP